MVFESIFFTTRHIRRGRGLDRAHGTFLQRTRGEVGPSDFCLATDHHRSRRHIPLVTMDRQYPAIGVCSDALGLYASR
jgi:hypothetical protein